MAPKVCIILINWNNLNDSLLCLDSIEKVRYPCFEIIAIDNGSEDDPEISLRTKSPNITYYRNRTNLGYTGGNNQGIKIALERGADYIWLLNNDATVEPNSLSNMVKVAESSPSIGIVSPVVQQASFDSKEDYMGTYLDQELFIKRNFKNLKELNETEITEPERVCLWGTSLLLKRNLVEKIGYLDERFFAYYEDMDYSLRSIKSGFFNKVDSSSVVYHKSKYQKPGGIPAYYFFYMARNEYLFWSKHQNRRKFASYKRNYLSKWIKKAAGLKEKNAMASANACLDGIWCALLNKYGIKNQQDIMPAIIKQVILSHPYFFSRLFIIM